MVSLRLQRHGRKRKPYYHIVAADQRSPRDGRIIERIGSFSPTDNPVLREVDADRAIYWLKNGAKPSDTVRSIFKKEGILYRMHLINWGKSDEEIAQALDEWKQGHTEESDKSIRAIRKEAIRKEEEAFKKQQAEAAKAEAEAAAAAAEEAAATKEEAAAEEAEASAEETAAEETTEAPAAEETTEEVEASAEQESEEEKKED